MSIEEVSLAISVHGTDITKYTELCIAPLVPHAELSHSDTPAVDIYDNYRFSGAAAPCS